ncbi:MAG TPA: sugar phosphate isomerase/epimerase [Bryobacteraceae bacterium]|nr:sugar phosphate isomerase/epimerase [Bryobacteraceae bacterium]
MKISLGSWAFSYGPYAAAPFSFEAIVKRLARAGYDGIEISGSPPHVTLEDYATKESRAQLVRLLADHNLGISGYTGDFYSVNPIAPGNETSYMDLLRRNVEMCADLGSPSLRVDTVAAPGSIPDSDYEHAFHRVAGLWGEGAEFAAKAGVRLVWEFEPGFAFNKPGEIIRMHQEVRHPNFSILFDTAHAYMSGVAGARQHGKRDVLVGGVEEFLDKLQGRIGAIHLIDSDGTLHRDETSTHRPFGQGRIDFDRLAPKLLAVPNIEWWTIDLCFWAGAWDLIEQSRQFVADLLARHPQFG